MAGDSGDADRMDCSTDPLVGSAKPWATPPTPWSAPRAPRAAPPTHDPNRPQIDPRVGSASTPQSFAQPSSVALARECCARARWPGLPSSAIFAAAAAPACLPAPPPLGPTCCRRRVSALALEDKRGRMPGHAACLPATQPPPETTPHVPVTFWNRRIHVQTFQNLRTYKVC